MKRFLQIALGLFVIAYPLAEASAQSALCQRYRADLAALDRGGGRQASAAAERQRAEIGRLSAYYRSIGCDRGPLGFLTGPAPAECGSIGQRIRQMEGNYATLAAQADLAGGGEARRRQLVAAIEQSCNGTQDAASGPRNFFESLFGLPSNRPAVPPQGIGEEGVSPEGETNQPLGGRRLACVRTCDGFFFPLANAPGGRENANDMCQALCPGTETLAFALPGSDDALRRAVSLSGRPYASLPTAFKFQKTFDSGCSCRKEGESWAQILRQAESMLDQRRGDVIVTAQKAEELSRPKPAAPTGKKPEPEQKSDPQKLNDAAEAQAAAEAGAAAPTASQESSGIGPRSIEAAPVIPQGQGANQMVPNSDGTRRAVRVIAPNIIPVPEMKTR